MPSSSYESLNNRLRNSWNCKPDTSLSSPLYYLLTGRKGIRVYEDQDSLLVTCAHPNVDGRLLVFPEIGRADYTLTASILNTRIDPPPNGVQLARHTQSEIEALRWQLANFRGANVAGIPVIEESVLDWHYPVYILGTERVASLKGPALRNLRRAFRKAVRDDNIRTILPLEHDHHIPFMREALQRWKESWVLRGKSQEGYDSYYEELFNLIPENPDTIHGLLFFDKEDRLAGFYIWDQPFGGTVNAIADIGDTTIRGFSEFRQVKACETLAADWNVHYVNIGGVEAGADGLDFWKRKLDPVGRLNPLSADVIYRPGLPPKDIQVSTIVEPS